MTTGFTVLNRPYVFAPFPTRTGTGGKTIPLPVPLPVRPPEVPSSHPLPYRRPGNTAPAPGGKSMCGGSPCGGTGSAPANRNLVGPGGPGTAITQPGPVSVSIAYPSPPNTAGVTPFRGGVTDSGGTVAVKSQAGLQITTKAPTAPEAPTSGHTSVGLVVVGSAAALFVAWVLFA